MNGNTTDNDWSTKWDQTIDLYPEGSINLLIAIPKRGKSGDGAILSAIGLYILQWRLQRNSLLTAGNRTAYNNQS